MNYYTSNGTSYPSSASFSAWLIEWDPAVPLLDVQVFDVDLTHVVLLVLEVLVDGLFDLIFQHLLGINALLIIRLAVVVNVSPDYVVTNEAALKVTRVQEGQIRLIIHLEVVNGPSQLIRELK